MFANTYNGQRISRSSTQPAYRVFKHCPLLDRRGMAQVEMGSTCCPQTGFEEITGDVPERDFWAESQNFCQALGERVQLAE
jgi:hypothetical protein